ncbi:hypothetical protein SAMN06265360_10619 [Haloechinothrix alba]|uniref:Tail assembly chaperone n=1 Tax=Haloechinothrix alba TaxID=664784 RepID=A0A238WC53_9PSEU|nr:hypothetical protein [Haloechinothrix alba]SNR44068.1 hypothetical protein SAMN06265360_10619 [Haloechinothrix alba]
MASEETERLRQEAAEAEVEDFEAFWNQQGRRGVRLNNVFGVDVELPAQLPLRYEFEARAPRGEESTRRMLSILFGEEALDTWIERGIDAEQLGVLLLWGAENADGNRISLARAREKYHQRMNRAGEQGKAETGKNKTTRGGSSSKGGR